MRKGFPGRIVTTDPQLPSGTPSVGLHHRLVHALTMIARITAEADSSHVGLQHALTTLCDALDWPIGHVYMRSAPHDPTFISARIWHLREPDRFQTFRQSSIETSFRPGQGLVGRVVTRRLPAVSADVVRDRRFLRRNSARLDDVHAWLALPVTADGEIFAVCELLTTERLELDRSVTALLHSVGMMLGRLYEREQRRQATDTPPTPPPAIGALAAAITHEINSPLLSARTSLSLLSATADDQPLLDCARNDLARIAAVMQQLHTLAEAAPIGSRLSDFLGSPRT